MQLIDNNDVRGTLSKTESFLSQLKQIFNAKLSLDANLEIQFDKFLKSSLFRS